MILDLQPSQDERDFRLRARDWLSNNVSSEGRPPCGSEASTYDRAWQRKLLQGGWAGINWPRKYGGLGLSGRMQMIWYEELARAKAPHYINSNYVGLMHAGPTLIACGNEEQKSRHLRRILSGEELWCQGFSEPNAGSDLASLTTRGVVEEEEIVVNGTKMWTTDALCADFQELLVRTDSGSQRHKGLTWLICDMQSPGIEVLPIRIMLANSHVYMVHYRDVRIPKSNVVGEIGHGWSVALSTLSFERGLGLIGDQLALLERVEQAIKIASTTRLECGSPAIEHEGIRERLAALKAEAIAIRSMTQKQVQETDLTNSPGPYGSLMKLMVTNTHKALCDLMRELLGWTFLEYDGDRESHTWTHDYLWSWVFTISGGTSEIQREIVADRLLGLPRAR